MEVRQRVARAVGDCIEQMGLTIPQFAALADVDPTTIRAFLSGKRWPQTGTIDKITAALGWDDIEMTRHALDGDKRIVQMISTADLIAELQRRTQTGRL